MTAADDSMPGSLDEGLLGLLEGRHLSPAQRRIAQYMLDNLPESVFLSSVELAERAGVSQPSVTRFATALGFSGYPDLRKKLQPLAVRSNGREPQPDGNEFQAAIDTDIRRLESLRAELANTDTLMRVGRSLAGSVPLPLLGLRISSSIAQSFGYRAKRVHPDVRVITRGEVVFDELLRAKQSGASWLLAFVLPRYPVAAIEALDYAKSIGLRCAIITDRPLVPFAHYADELLTSGVNDRFVFDSHASPLMLSMLVLKALVDAKPQRAQRRLEEFERMVRSAKIFVPE